MNTVIETAFVKEAREFASKAHIAQEYDGSPYTKHLDDVFNVLKRFGFTEEEDADLMISSYLHDIIEDTATSYSDLKKKFGIEIAEIVYCMTDELGRNRKEKKEKTYPKLRSNMRSVTLKVADRIANIENSLNKGAGGGFLDMYKKEFTEFQNQLRIHGHITEMWEHLNKLVQGAYTKVEF